LAAISPLENSILRELADILGATESGLTNREIDELLRMAAIPDPNPQPANAHVFRALNKRDRLYTALEAQQKRDGAANAVLQFVVSSMRPVRFRDRPAIFEAWRQDLNEALAFAGLMLHSSGEIVPRAGVAKTLDQAGARSRRLRRQLGERNVHARILAACELEIADDNYFHTVLEATKSLGAEIRAKSGLKSDGVELVNQSFERGQNAYPLLACNSLQTPTHWSEQRGVAELLRGIFGAFRNPTAHEPRVTWFVSEDDALDALSAMSWLHRKLDSCVTTVTTPIAPSRS
jgi:uncharacterized protein (TIGR02391 family)